MLSPLRCALRIIVILLGVFIHSGASHAAKDDFDPEFANQTLDKLSIKLSTQNLVAEDLFSASKILLQMQSQAQECVDNYNKEIENLEVHLPGPSSGISPNSVLTPEQQYLFNKKNEAMDKRTKCKIFVLRSQEAITAFTETAENITTSEIFSQGPNTARLLQDIRAHWDNMRGGFNSSLFLDKLGLPQLSGILLFIVLIWGSLSGWFALKAKLELSRALSFFKTTMGAEQRLQSAICVLHAHCTSLVLSGSFCLLVTAHFLYSQKGHYLLVLSIGWLLWALFKTLISFLFLPPNSYLAFCEISDKVANRLVFRLKILGLLCVAGTLGFYILADQSYSQDLYFLMKAIFFSLIAISMFSILWTINLAPILLIRYKKARGFVSFILSILLITVLISEWNGYQNFSTYLLSGISISVLTLFLAWLIHSFSRLLIRSFNTQDTFLQQKLQNYLGTEKEDTLPELAGLRFAFFIMIWGTAILVITTTWSLSESWSLDLKQAILEGFAVGEATIVPSRIIFGFITFFILVTISRFIRALVRQQKTSKPARARQEAFASILGYIGFSLALLFALLIAGVNLAGLALIAGALSVGIGFGLQNIVNNFVSGIVLLLERPIKPGDRIIVGDQEGFVKKVSIRSTRIYTLEHSDVIVPNAQLVSDQVTNFMYKNHKWRITTFVGVAYGSPVELVAKLMFEAACAHPQILDKGADQPKVFFKEFSDNALTFEMWSIIKDVNLKEPVNSELNFAIDKIFRENNIEIAFPQTDLHIKDSVPLIPINLSKITPKD